LPFAIFSSSAAILIESGIKTVCFVSLYLGKVTAVMVFRSIFTASFFFVGENTSAGTVSVRGAAKVIRFRLKVMMKRMAASKMRSEEINFFFCIVEEGLKMGR